MTSPSAKLQVTWILCWDWAGDRGSFGCMEVRKMFLFVNNSHLLLQEPRFIGLLLIEADRVSTSCRLMGQTAHHALPFWVKWYHNILPPAVCKQRCRLPSTLSRPGGSKRRRRSTLSWNTLPMLLSALRPRTAMILPCARYIIDIKYWKDRQGVTKLHEFCGFKLGIFWLSWLLQMIWAPSPRSPPNLWADLRPFPSNKSRTPFHGPTTGGYDISWISPHSTHLHSTLVFRCANWLVSPKEKWLEAGHAWRKAGRWLRAMWDFLNGQHFADFASCAQLAYDSAEDQDEVRSEGIPSGNASIAMEYHHFYW